MRYSLTQDGVGTAQGDEREVVRFVEVGEDPFFEGERQSEEWGQLLFKRRGLLDHAFRYLWQRACGAV